MKAIKVSKLLRKSYKIRSVLDVFQHSKNLILFHNDKYNENLFNDFRKKLSKDKIYFKLLNKDDFLLLDFGSYVKGPTVLMFFENFFNMPKISTIINNNKNIFGDILLIKVNNFMNLRLFNLINEKYKFEMVKVFSQIILYVNLVKLYFIKLVFLFRLKFILIYNFSTKLFFNLMVFNKENKNIGNDNFKSIN